MYRDHNLAAAMKHMDDQANYASDVEKELKSLLTQDELKYYMTAPDDDYFDTEAGEKFFMTLAKLCQEAERDPNSILIKTAAMHLVKYLVLVMTPIAQVNVDNRNP